MERVLVPPRIRVWSRDNWHIYFDPYNFVWIKVNNSGRLLLEMLRKYMTIAQMTDYVVKTYGLTYEKAEGAIRIFVNGLVNSGFLHINEYRERDRAIFPKLDFPHDIYLHVTNKCNLKCPYCYNKGDREMKLKLERKGELASPLSTEEYKNLIVRIIDYGVRRIVFTGGEPLMRPDIMELIEFARSKSETVYLEMLTNAIKIDDRVAEKMCRHMDTVTISLDGHEQHIHEFYRGKGTFDPTVRGIKRLIAKRKQLNQQKPFVCIVPTLTNKNIVKLKEIFEFALEELGADGLAPIIFQAGDHQELNTTQIPELGVYLEAMNRTNEYLSQRAAKFALPAETKPHPIHPRNHCGVGHGEISVDPSGFVYPCQSLHFSEFICGNVRQKDIKEIFNESPIMKKLRSVTVDRVAVCSHCDLRYLCNGGCRATAYNVYRHLDAHNEIYCKHLETIAVGKLWGSSMISAQPV